MTFPELIAMLSDPQAYPFPLRDVAVRQTHISVVFLAGEYAYKIRKPVSIGFLDFGTLEKRRTDCDREVVLNRRLAQDVYLGVVPVARSANGLAVEGTGEVVEWAVKMRRLPDEATLLARLRRGDLDDRTVETVASRIAAFHLAAAGGERAAAFGRFDAVADNARENFTQAEPGVGRIVSRAVFDRLRVLTEVDLDRLRPLIERRASAGTTKDTHGDLHLDHVYLFPDRKPPGDIVVLDCVEFNERFRYADPVADMAFLAMDLGFRGRRDLADAFAEAYFRAARDAEGRPLLPLYVAYRAVVRAKVEGMQLDEEEVTRTERDATLLRARAHWLYALSELEAPGLRPCLILVGGLPGTGKSTLAAGLADRAGFHVIRSDVVRKELAGLSPGAKAGAPDRTGIYSADFTERTYSECLSRAEKALFEGHRVAVDASFAADRHRRQFLDAAASFAVPGVFFHCRATPGVIQARLGERRGDPSDADWVVYQAVAARWEPIGPEIRLASRDIETDDKSPDVATNRALECLRSLGLHE